MKKEKKKRGWIKKTLIGFLITIVLFILLCFINPLFAILGLIFLDDTFHFPQTISSSYKAEKHLETKYGEQFEVNAYRKHSLWGSNGLQIEAHPKSNPNIVFDLYEDESVWHDDYLENLLQYKFEQEFPEDTDRKYMVFVSVEDEDVQQDFFDFSKGVDLSSLKVYPYISVTSNTKSDSLNPKKFTDDVDKLIRYVESSKINPSVLQFSEKIETKTVIEKESMSGNYYLGEFEFVADTKTNEISSVASINLGNVVSQNLLKIFEQDRSGESAKLHDLQVDLENDENTFEVPLTEDNVDKDIQIPDNYVIDRVNITYEQDGEYIREDLVFSKLLEIREKLLKNNVHFNTLIVDWLIPDHPAPKNQEWYYGESHEFKFTYDDLLKLKHIEDLYVQTEFDAMSAYPFGVDANQTQLIRKGHGIRVESFDANSGLFSLSDLNQQNGKNTAKVTLKELLLLRGDQTFEPTRKYLGLDY